MKLNWAENSQPAKFYYSKIKLIYRNIHILLIFSCYALYFQDHSLMESAVRSGSLNTVIYLLGFGLNPNDILEVSDGVEDSQSLLHVALELGIPETINEMITLLLDHGKGYSII